MSIYYLVETRMWRANVRYILFFSCKVSYFTFSWSSGSVSPSTVWLLPPLFARGRHGGDRTLASVGRSYFQVLNHSGSHRCSARKAWQVTVIASWRQMTTSSELTILHEPSVEANCCLPAMKSRSASPGRLYRCWRKIRGKFVISIFSLSRFWRSP